MQRVVPEDVDKKIHTRTYTHTYNLEETIKTHTGIYDWSYKVENSLPDFSKPS